MSASSYVDKGKWLKINIYQAYIHDLQKDIVRHVFVILCLCVATAVQSTILHNWLANPHTSQYTDPAWLFLTNERKFVD